MGMSKDAAFPRRRITRRDLMRIGMGTAGLALLGTSLAACQEEEEPAAPGETDQPGETPEETEETPAETVGSVVFLSTQLRPVEEAEKMRNVILADFPGEVDFIPEDEGSFIDRLIAEAQAGRGAVGVVGGQHGDFASLAARDLLTDLSDLVEQLADRGFNEQYLELARFGGDELLYIPWMQATYIMAAHRDAEEHLPDGADVNALTYEQLGEWARNVSEASGARRLGFPAGERGLWHRFFQGYSYPSFTGALNTKFKSPEAVEMWEWLREAWQEANPQSVTYGFMQEPLLAGEVWIAWDHTARLIEALRTRPDDFLTFPAPIGPAGLGFMPVIAGLGIPKNAPDPEASRALIEYLTRPETAQLTLREVAFFPPTELAELPEDLDPGIRLAAEAVSMQTNSDQALPSLLPIGLGDQGGAYNKVFRDAFQRIILDGEDIAGVLESEAANLQAVLDSVEAPCWPPDPESDGTCQVG